MDGASRRHHRHVGGLGKGAFYRYIGSKQKLLAAIHDRVIDEVMPAAARVGQAGGSPARVGTKGPSQAFFRH